MTVHDLIMAVKSDASDLEDEGNFEAAKRIIALCHIVSTQGSLYREIDRQMSCRTNNVRTILEELNDGD